MIKKILCVLLAAAVMAGSCGCKGGNGDGNKGEEAPTTEQRGGYIETEVTFSSSENLRMPSMGTVKNFVLNPDGSIYYRCLRFDDAGAKSGVYRLNGTEAELICGDVEKAIGNNNANVFSFFDGCAYAMVYPSKNSPEVKFVRVPFSGDNADAEKLLLIDEIFKNAGGLSNSSTTLYPLTQDRYAVVAQNFNYSDESISYHLVNEQTMESKEIMSFNYKQGDSSMVIANPGEAYELFETNEVVFFRCFNDKAYASIYSLGEDRLLEGETAFNYEGSYCIFAGADTEALYFLDEGGINRVARGGSIVERIMEANRYELVSPQWIPVGAVRAPDGDFYVCLYNISSGEGKVMLYSYDADIIIPAQTEFRIIASTNTPPIRAAIDAFRREHRDLNVETVFINDSASGAYVVGWDDSLSAEERLIQQEELLKAAKAEIIAGNGANLLLLEAADMKELADAGCFMDLSEAVPRGEMPAAIYETLKNENGVPAIPVELTVPCLYGLKENLDGVNSIDDIFAKADELGLYAFKCESKAQAFDYFIYTSYNSIIGSGELNEANFKKFLVYVDELLDKYSYSEYGGTNPLIDNTSHPSEWLHTSLGAYRGDNPKVAFGMVTDYGVAGLNELFSIYSFGQGESAYTAAWFKLMPGLDEGAFVPGMCAGINVNSANTEAAEEFINLLISEEVQLGDEYSIINNGYSITVLPSVTQMFADALVERAFTPALTEEEAKTLRYDFVALTNSLKTPEIIDNETLLILCDATEKYCENEITADEAVSEVKARLGN